MSDVVDAEMEEEMVPLGIALNNADAMRARGADPFGAGARLTDTGNAERWANAHGARFRFHAGRGCWFRWDGMRWKDDAEGEAMLSTKDVARDYLVDALAAGDPKTRLDLVKHANRAESKGAREAMLSLAASEPGMSVAATAFDADPWALNTTNGVVDLKSGEMRAHSAAELHTKLAPVAFDADAKAPRFERFLAEALPDAEVRAFVMRFFGYALTGVVREHVLPVFYGSGGNGKGTLVETVGAVVGDYGKAIPADLLMRKGGGNDQHPTERATLLGLRLAFASETEAGRALAESTVKTLTGGDTISARFMRQDFFEFSPTHKIVLSTNHRPVIKGTDRGIWRRVRLVPFETVPAVVDTSLKDALLSERPGILAMLVAACLEWQRDGLGTAASIEAATKDYRDESDTLGIFLSACTVATADARTRSSELYAAYRRWCEESGESAWTQASFSRALGERGHKAVRHAHGMVFKGLGVLADRVQSVGSNPAFPVDPRKSIPHGNNRVSAARPYTPTLLGGAMPSDSEEEDIPWGGE